MKKLKVLELFAGTRSIGKAFESKGHEVVSVEWNKDFEDIDEYCDIGTLTAEYLTEKYGYFDVVWASPDCFAEGTLVWTNAGYKDIKDVECGDYVLSHKGNYKKVYRTIKKNTPVLNHIKISGSEEIIATENHPFYVRKKKRINTYKNGETVVYTELQEPEWIEAKNLTTDYKVGIPINKNSIIPIWNGTVYFHYNQYGKTHSELHNNISRLLEKNTFWWIVGRYFGDGSLNIDKATVDISANKNNDEHKEILEKLDDLDFKYNIYKKKTAIHVCLFSKELVEFLMQFGVGALHKRITGNILNLPIELLKSFLDGYISADGYWDTSLENPCCSITTVSRELAYGLQLCIIKAYKRYASMCVRNNSNFIQGRYVNTHKAYQLNFYRDNNKKRMHYIFDNDYVWVNIRSNYQTRSKQESVYCISVEDDESFTANNISVHNCTSYSVAAISHHRKKNKETGNLDPISDYAKFCDNVNQHMLELIKELNPTYYFIENPRGCLRKMKWMQGIPRYTVTYCQYGERRMKPTDIWTNHPNPKFKPPCKNGDTCHDAAPRGSQTGTQAIKSAIDKARIPKLLCEHIVDICEEIYPDYLYEQCKKCKNLFSSEQCELCDDFDMFKE